VAEVDKPERFVIESQAMGPHFSYLFFFGFFYFPCLLADGTG
jgi:hypothetical protein